MPTMVHDENSRRKLSAGIQTLGHLGQMLQWNKYAGLRDTADVILAEAVETYDFIEKVCLLSSFRLNLFRTFTEFGLVSDDHGDF